MESIALTLEYFIHNELRPHTQPLPGYLKVLKFPQAVTMTPIIFTPGSEHSVKGPASRHKWLDKLINLCYWHAISSSPSQRLCRMDYHQLCNCDSNALDRVDFCFSSLRDNEPHLLLTNGRLWNKTQHNNIIYSYNFNSSAAWAQRQTVSLTNIKIVLQKLCPKS